MCTVLYALLPVLYVNTDMTLHTDKRQQKIMYVYVLYAQELYTGRQIHVMSK